jgi:hypothetical protein
MLEQRPERAAEALRDFPEAWRPDAQLEAEVWIATGEAAQAVARLRERIAERDAPALRRLLVRALLAAGELGDATRAVQDEAAGLAREEFFDVEAALFYAGRFEDSALVAADAFERFGVPDDAYNVACACARTDRLDEAVAWLQRALAAGYSDAAHLEGDEDLAALHGREDFAALRARLRTH